MILWGHRLICGASLTETSLCGAYLFSKLKTGDFATMQLILVGKGFLQNII